MNKIICINNGIVQTIKDTAFIDTGATSYLSIGNEILEKYDIDVLDANSHVSLMTTGHVPAFSLPIDTIKIGNQYVAKQNMRVGFRYRKGFPNLIGVGTLENFSIILDLINYDLYLKKIDNCN